MKYSDIIENDESQLFQGNELIPEEIFMFPSNDDSSSSDDSPSIVLKAILSKNISEDDIRIFNHLRMDSILVNSERSPQVNDTEEIKDSFQSISNEDLLHYYGLDTDANYISATENETDETSQIEEIKEPVQASHPATNRRVGRVSKNIDRRDFK